MQENRWMFLARQANHNLDVMAWKSTMRTFVLIAVPMAMLEIYLLLKLCGR